MKKSTIYLKKAALWYFRQIEPTSAFAPTGMVPKNFTRQNQN